jgi:sorting nexin-4
MDFEGLSAYLQQTVQDKERIKANDATNISDLVVDKINEVRGMDMERARREKLVRLEIKIKELQEEVAQTNDISHDFSEQVVDEFELFQQCKTNEIKRGLTSYVDVHVDFYQKVSHAYRVLEKLTLFGGHRGFQFGKRSFQC